VNILDENVPENQRQLLSSWRVSIRQIGYDIGQDGMQDGQIIHLLHQTRRSTFFTLDVDFYKSSLCHKGYCVVYLSVAQFEAGWFVRRVLRHPQLDTQAKRMGKVIRASHAGLTIWQLHAKDYVELTWTG
jgi:hypothetical protein